MIYNAGGNDDGILLRTYIRSRLGYSRAALSSLKQREGGIKVNGKSVTVRTVIHDGDEIFLDTSERSPSTGIPLSGIAPDILYEDEYIIALNKPPHLPVHPVRDHQGDTLAGRVMSYMGENFVFRCATRLDLNTSGAVIVSKDRLTSSKLSDMLSNGVITKRYLMICVKNEKYTEYTLENSGNILYNIRMKSNSFMEREAVTESVRERDKTEEYIRASANDSAGDKRNPVSHELTPEGREAVTRYRVIKENGPYRLIEAFPETGRTHQLRVHFAYSGCPVLGDTLYGEASEIIPRQALHCAEVSFVHPITGERLSIRAPLHDDFLSAMKDTGFETNDI